MGWNGFYFYDASGFRFFGAKLLRLSNICEAINAKVGGKVEQLRHKVFALMSENRSINV